MTLSGETEHSAQFEILAGHTIAVKEYCGRTLAPVKVVEPDTSDGQKPAGRRMTTLRFARPIDVPGGHRRTKGDTGL